MPTNLRLRPHVADAVRAEAARTGRSQQDVMRDAIESYLAGGSVDAATARGAQGATSAASGILPPRTPWRRAAERIRLPKGATSIDALEREDRI